MAERGESRALSEVGQQLQEIVRALVDRPDDVVVREEDLGHTVVLKVHAPHEELGKLIGRQGRTVRALRSLLEVRSAAGGTFYDIEVVEP